MTSRAAVTAAFLIAIIGAGVQAGAGSQRRLAASVQQRQQDGKPTDYARMWESWGEGYRNGYVLGFMEGEINGVVDSIDWFRPKVDGAITTQYDTLPLKSSGMTVGVLQKVMTDLYQDPANSLIPFSQILSIGRERLSGRPVDDLLVAARQAAVTK